MVTVCVCVSQPSDEDSQSLNVPMSHITEEDGLNRDDSSEHINALTGTAHTHTHTHKLEHHGNISSRSHPPCQSAPSTPDNRPPDWGEDRSTRASLVLWVCVQMPSFPVLVEQQSSPEPADSLALSTFTGSNGDKTLSLSVAFNTGHGLAGKFPELVCVCVCVRQRERVCV